MLAERIVKLLFNYISDFTGGGSGLMSPQAMIPTGMSVIAKNFLNKVEAGGVGFLELFPLRVFMPATQKPADNRDKGKGKLPLLVQNIW
jgi:hypothetical protein